MDLTALENDQIVKIDYIFLMRRLVEAEDNNDGILKQEINSLLYSIQEYAEEHKCMPYGPTIRIRDAKKMFPVYINSCPIVV